MVRDLRRKGLRREAGAPAEASTRDAAGATFANSLASGGVLGGLLLVPPGRHGI